MSFKSCEGEKMIKLSLLDTVEVKGNDMSNEIKIFCPQGLYIYLLYDFF